ncbi:uncharacterized protein LOC105015513 [Esox lucius]|uniref:uncharacterized protein LOC105015513 n=1 Tax=Esox lucius TaxID=8010 RepID=UPI001476AE72|nr:uncharacterized protein LOC105015513 [Esox lucius]
MGSGSSRGKKVVPASFNETNAFKTEDIVDVLKEENHLYKPLKIQTFTKVRLSGNRTQPRTDCHIEGHDSEFEDDIGLELDRGLEEYENRELRSKKKHFPKMPFIRSTTYGLCISRRVHNEMDFNSTPHLQSSGMSDRIATRSENASVRVNDTKCIRVFNRFCKDKQMHILSDTRENDLTTGTVGEYMHRAEAQSVPNNSQGPSHSLPAILYNDSEVDLMETIEREFG